MWGEILTIFCLLLSALSVSLRKFYLESPIIEPSLAQTNPVLKRRSVKSTKREHILSGFLITIAVLGFCLFAVASEAYMPKFVYFLLLASALFFVFFYLPAKNSGRLIMDIASFLTPIFIAGLNKTKKQTKALEKRFSEREKIRTTSKYLTKNEIIDVLNQQKRNYDGRSLAQGLALAINFLELGSKRVEEFMLPIEDVHVVGFQETAGPILIDELHKSGYKIFPVSSKDEGIVGSVQLADLVNVSEGDAAIKDAMKNNLQFLSEDDNIAASLDIFASSGMTMFIVKNGSKNSGVLYLEDLIAQILHEK